MKRGYLFIALATLFFSTMEIALKEVAGLFNPVQLNLTRFLIGGLVLIPFARRMLRKRGVRIDGLSLVKLAGLGFLGIVVSMTLYQLAVENTNASVVAVLFSCNPVFVLVFAGLILRTQILRQHVMALVLECLGILILINPLDTSISTAGITFTLLSTAVFGFPVFCLVCPVGLTFGTLVVVWRVFQFNEVTWSLLVFPAMLVLELAVLRKWCHRFCPLGALLSLVSRGNRTFRPQANVGTCLHAAHGERCHRCADACPEGIDLHDRAASAPLNECVKCRECADACPVHAITFPFLSKKPLLEPSAAERDTKEEQ